MMHRKPETSLAEDLVNLGILSGDVAKKALSEDEAADKDMAAKPEEKPEEKKEEPKDEKKPEEKKEAPAKEMPAFLKSKDDEKKEESYAEQLEAAWDVVRSYYTMSEDEDKGLKVEDLRTVINAFAFICEAQYNSGEPTKKPDDTPGAGADMFPDGENPLKQKATANSPTAPEWKKDKYGERGRAKSDKSPAAPYHRSGPVKTEGLNDLVADLKALQSAVAESGPSADDLALQESLVEGFEAVKATAAEVAARIGAELSESKTVAEDDDRKKAFEYFDGIAQDSADILAAIANKQVEIAEAVEDLRTISTDLKTGLDLLKNVD